MFKHIAMLFIGATGLMLLQPGFAITADSLKQKLNKNEAIVIIDVRINALYQKSHIANAISIPASIIALKKLPHLGSVVVYGDGIDEEEAYQAMRHLNAKPGIQADVLKGGFSAWSARNNIVQRQNGLGVPQIKHVTYQKLQKMTQGENSIVLVDLRTGTEQESLSEHFPDTEIYDSVTVNDVIQDKPAKARVNRKLLSGIPKHNRSVLILIDDGNGLSEKVADKLHAASTKRLAILTGGEQALRSRGIISQKAIRTGE